MLSLLLAAASLAPSPALQETFTWRETLDAIRVVETGGEPDEGRGAIGDDGNALGSYQIWQPYWTDAVEREPALAKGGYRRVLKDKAHSERIVRAYMARYNRDALRRLEAGRGTLADVLRTARIHNGGPKGYRKEATLKYADKVRKEISR